LGARNFSGFPFFSQFKIFDPCLMGAVVSLSARREEKIPHLSGWAKCIGCGHRWMAVSPVTDNPQPWMECPSCQAEKGIFVAPCLPEDGKEIWRCSCGGEFFVILRGTFMCANCGTHQHFEGA
jgi:hypothetical protein